MREEPEISLQSAARLPIFPTTQQKGKSNQHDQATSRHQRSATVIYVRGTRPDRTARYAAKPERNYRLASRPASVPKGSASPHQARDAKVDGETPPAALEARQLESGGGRRDASHAKNHKRLRVTTHTRTTEARFTVKVTPTRKQV
ncbi:hypothetical protein pipiens_008168, partial [Culex pipiens pipiens]